MENMHVRKRISGAYTKKIEMEAARTPKERLRKLEIVGGGTHDKNEHTEDIYDNKKVTKKQSNHKRK